MGKKAINIIEQLQDRQDRYDDHTTNIYEQIKKVTDVLEDKIKEEPSLTSGICVWHDISSRPEVPDVLFLHMSIEFPIGTRIETPTGSYVTITEDTAGYFNKDVVAGIEIGVFDLTSKKAIRKALQVVSTHDSSTDSEPQPEESMSEVEARAMLLAARNPTGVKH